MNWKLFLQTIAASAIAESAKAATSYIGSIGPADKLNWKTVGNSALIGALLGALAAMAQPAPQTPAPTQS
jgi:hypothetical protein